MKIHFFTSKRIKLSLFIIFSFLTTFLANESFAQISSTTVTVNTSSSITGVTANPTAVCTGGSVELAVDGSLGTGASWTWYTGSCGGTVIGTGTTITVNPVNAGTDPISITYYIQSTGGSCSASSCESVTITVNPTPVITPPSDVTYCYNTITSPVAVSGTPSGYTFDIEGGATIGLSDATGATEIPGFTATNSGSTPLTVTITLTPRANGCSGSPVTFDITVLPQITMADPADLTACNGTTVPAIVFSGAPAGSVYNWTNSNTTIGLDGSGAGPIDPFTGTNTDCINNTGIITVTPQLTVNTITCSGAGQDFSITVFPTPDGTISGDEVCQGEDAQLTFNSTCGTGPFGLEIGSGTTTPPFQAYTGIVSGNAFNITPQPGPGATTYNLMKITDSNGCIRE